MKTITKKVFSQLPNEFLQEFEGIVNKKHGISIKKMPSKVYGVFQKNYTRLTLVFDENVIGKTCNGEDFFNALKKANVIVNKYKDYQF